MCWFLSVWFLPVARDVGLCANRNHVRSNVNFHYNYIQAFSTSASYLFSKKTKQVFWATVVDALRSECLWNFYGMSELSCFFEYQCWCSMCFARGAQFFTLREWCHGHNLRLTSSLVVDADRMFSALTQDFKGSPPTSEVCFFIAQQKSFHGCGFHVVKISCQSLYFF